MAQQINLHRKPGSSPVRPDALNPYRRPKPSEAPKLVPANGAELAKWVGCRKKVVIPARKANDGGAE